MPPSATSNGISGVPAPSVRKYATTTPQSSTASGSNTGSHCTARAEAAAHADAGTATRSYDAATGSVIPDNPPSATVIGVVDKPNSRSGPPEANASRAACTAEFGRRIRAPIQ